VEEIKFIFKCLIFASLVVVFAQTKFQGESLESKAEMYLHQSSVADTLREVAIGGAELAQTAYQKTETFAAEQYKKFKK
jgi:hypothetical protein